MITARIAAELPMEFARIDLNILEAFKLCCPEDTTHFNPKII